MHVECVRFPLLLYQHINDQAPRQRQGQAEHRRAEVQSASTIPYGIKTEK